MTGKVLSSFIQTNIPFFTKVKGSDEIRTSDSTLTADAVLKFNAKANKIYFIRTWSFFISNTTADFKDALIIPANATAQRIDNGWNSETIITTEDWEVENTYQTGSVEVCLATFGKVIMGATEGEISYAWAQNTSNAGSTTVKAGSYIEVYES